MTFDDHFTFNYGGIVEIGLTAFFVIIMRRSDKEQNACKSQLNQEPASRLSSLISELECSECGKKVPSSLLQTICPDCRSPLLARYDLEAARNTWTATPFVSANAGCGAGMSRFQWRTRRISFPSARGIPRCCPCQKLAADSGFSNLFVKDESTNPTGSFKARGLAAAVSKAKELGIQKVIIPTAGNAGGAMAAYAARAGLQALIYMPRDTPRAKIRKPDGRCASSVGGWGISDAARIVGEKATTLEDGSTCPPSRSLIAWKARKSWDMNLPKPSIGACPT